MKICIAGKNNIAINAVNYLIDTIGIDKNNIFILVNKNDTGIDSWQGSLKKYAKDIKVDILELEDTYNIEDLIFISLEYDRIIKPKLFKSQRLYNLHFSELPKYKGVYTSAWPIINGEEYTGVTLHKIDSGIDTGDIIDQILFNIDIDWTCKDLYLNYLEYGFILFKRNLGAILDNSVIAKKQPCIGSSYYSLKSIDYRNIFIDLNKTAYEIYNQIRAFIFKEYQLPVLEGYKIKSAKLSCHKSEQKNRISIAEDTMYIRGIDGYVIIAKLCDMNPINDIDNS